MAPCWPRYGETTVLCTAVAARTVKPGQDFFPLTVNYQEKTFAAGKIPGGFFKREGRPAEKETLTSRLIDRPIRPLFPDGFRNETQVICTVLAHDQENDPDIVAMIGASAALTLSGIPFLGPIGGARVGYIDGEYLLNPTDAGPAGSELDLVVAGTRDGVMMVESEAKELPEEIMLGAVLFGQQQFQPVIDADHRAGRGVRQGALGARSSASTATLYEHARARGSRRSCARPTRESGKQARHERVEAVKAAARSRRSAARRARSRRRCSSAVQEAREGDRARRHPGHRAAHRRPRHHARVRPIVGRGRRAAARRTAARCSRAARPRRWWSPRSAPARTSRSSTRSRASTASTSCCTTTSRPTRSARPACCARPGRREIGHGKLAWRAVRPLLPPQRELPLHDPRGLGDHRIERLQLDGDGVRQLARADGRRRAARRGRSPASPWA